MFELFEHQLKALDKIHNGCILHGGVGSGKSLTALAYYYMQNGGSRSFLTGHGYSKMKNPKDLYIITTARKRDLCEWEEEMTHFLLSTDERVNPYSNEVVVDSWNNIGKYKDVKNAFFIFDEQRVVGYGAWTKSFLKIAKSNEWILLSATPGDSWKDYMPVFIANGYYRNKTDFEAQHIIYDWHVKSFPKIDRYINTGRLIRLRSRVLVPMNFERNTTQHHKDIFTDYDKALYRMVQEERWNPYKNKPIKNASEYCQTLRRIVNESPARLKTILDIFNEFPRIIIFYNYDYELDILREGLENAGIGVCEWNSHKHQAIPDSSRWAYLVQYNANEGWNCIQTNCIIFYSMNYSYKTMVQAAGRIDRLNTPYKDLYYFHLKSKSMIDYAITKNLKEKKTFNESSFYRAS